MSSHDVADLMEFLSGDSLLIWKTLVGLKAVNINRLISTQFQVHLYSIRIFTNINYYIYSEVFSFFCWFEDVNQNKKFNCVYRHWCFLRFCISVRCGVNRSGRSYDSFVYPVTCVTCRLVKMYVTRSPSLGSWRHTILNNGLHKLFKKLGSARLLKEFQMTPRTWKDSRP